MMNRFLSMGVDCEFGMVQKLCGIDPPDLLRWTYTELPVLNRMLADRFRHIATPEHLSLFVTNGEYNMRNAVYGTRWHTWARVDQVTPDRLMRRECLRLRRQAEWLIEELEHGRRILVRKAKTAQENASLYEFAQRISLYGECPILFVSEDPNRHGKVFREGANLLRGYLARFAPPEDIRGQAEAAPWVALCRTALSLAPDRCHGAAELARRVG